MGKVYTTIILHDKTWRATTHVKRRFNQLLNRAGQIKSSLFIPTTGYIKGQAMAETRQQLKAEDQLWAMETRARGLCEIDNTLLMYIKLHVHKQTKKLERKNNNIKYTLNRLEWIPKEIRCMEVGSGEKRNRNKSSFFRLNPQMHTNQHGPRAWGSELASGLLNMETGKPTLNICEA